MARKQVLVTGSTGFIGWRLCEALLVSEQLRQQGYDIRLAAGQCGLTEGNCYGDAVRQGFLVHEIRI